MEIREISLMELGNFKTCKHRNMFEQLKLFNSIINILGNTDKPLSANEIARLINEPRKRYAKGDRYGNPPYDFRYSKKTDEGYSSNCRYVLEDDVTKEVVAQNIKRLVEIGVVDYNLEPAIDTKLFEKMFGKNTGVIVPDVKKYFLK